jgi:hypothetical protein
MSLGTGAGVDRLSAAHELVAHYDAADGLVNGEI